MEKHKDTETRRHRENAAKKRVQCGIFSVPSCLCVFVFSFCFMVSSSGQASARPAAPQSAVPSPARQLVTAYCITCHNERSNTGNLALDSADAEHVVNSAETWEKVIVKL